MFQKACIMKTVFYKESKIKDGQDKIKNIRLEE